MNWDGTLDAYHLGVVLTDLLLKNGADLSGGIPRASAIENPIVSPYMTALYALQWT